MYKSLEARLHDVFWNAEAPGLELKLILEHLEGREGKCFEIGCGSGRILLPLNEQGFHTDGNDISQDMLNLLEKERAEGVFKVFDKALEEIDISSYTHFLVPAFTFMLMPEGGVEKALRYISEHAPVGATLYFTIFMPWAEICGELEEGEWYKDHEAENVDGAKASCKTQFTIDRTHQCVHRKHKYLYRSKEGEKEKYISEQQLRWFTYQEMSFLLKQTGWEVEKSIFDLDPEADSENAHLYTFIATRKK